MIISASRRTDIPAFYTPWFINRIRAGYCSVPNPQNLKQVAHVSLKPQDVDVIIFWTRNPAPLMPYLTELDQMGFRYYFQYTILDYPKEIDHKAPGFEAAIKTFRHLSDCIGPERVIWRYDPILFSEKTGADYHRKKYQEIAEMLNGFTVRSVVSIVDEYKKSKKRMGQLAEQGIQSVPILSVNNVRFQNLMRDFHMIASTFNMEITSCAEDLDLSVFGISHGKCIDDELIRRIFNIEVASKKDPSQRKACGCVVSKDIGMYDSCLFGCQYCYATQSFDRAKNNHDQHNPESPSLLGWHEAKPLTQEGQLSLFDGN